MKSIFTLALSLLSLVQAAPPTANGTRFSIDGETRYFAGTDSYWIGFLINDHDVDTVLDHISSSGLTGNWPTSRAARDVVPMLSTSGQLTSRPISEYPYIRSLDRSHMITLGNEGFGLPGATSYPYQPSEGVDFVKNLAIKDLDFGTFHFYPQSWGLSNAAGAAWIKDHASACKKAGKPCLFEEYGTSTDHCNIERPWQQASLQAVTEGMVADLFWQWGDKLSTGQTHNDGNTIYYGSADANCLVTERVKAINFS
ncbi:beta-1,4-endoglucanase [Neurospora tetraspora]|uniref:mannan endo-1,4-beta-mannosidase n=1 Tax=Neurospora tetraspora TaxID=94610 RepID=A0AAE0J9L0_9PEZI|nr:beta-1,4-endoglucanase [Neurospora tetraspora]